jgi:hypothetical protein
MPTIQMSQFVTIGVKLLGKIEWGRSYEEKQGDEMKYMAGCTLKNR